jgi:tetratricopeptide (TPR) repeat protein
MEPDISNDDLNRLLKRVEYYLLTEDYTCAISLLSQEIDNSSSKNINLPFLLSNRASISSTIQAWDSAIADIQRCISLSPDNSQFYLSMGVYITWKHFYANKFRIDGNNAALKKSICFYREGLMRDPTNATAWLNIIETYLFIMEWENALSHLGMCKSYLYVKENKLIWTWLTCLALVLAGDPLEPDDRELLVNETFQYKTNHDCQQIDCVISELERTRFYPERVKLAKEIHQLYKARIRAK